jgi:D-serine dehydratase
VQTEFVRSILDMPLDSRSKGIPVTAGSIRLEDVGTQDWNVPRGDMMLPLLTVRQGRLRNNLRIMREYAAHHGVYLAPHGKTTVCPQLYLEQMQDGGSWGITAATVQQAAVVAATGIPHIIIANEVVSRGNVEQLAALKLRYPDAAFYSLVDSEETVAQLARFGKSKLGGGKFQVLLEVGYAGGRTGTRNMDSAMAVLKAVQAHSDGVELCGVECYEGVISRPDPDAVIRAIDELLDLAVAVLGRCRDAKALRSHGEILLTAGGSAYFDRVVDKFTKGSGGARVVLRGGCYLTYDHGAYEAKLQNLDKRGGLEGPHGHISAFKEFQPALELWATVQSLQDAGTAILSMGVRDLPFDLGYPRPLRHYRDGLVLTDLDANGLPFRVTNSNDQHCYMTYPAGTDIKVGDMVACGISHPCTAFDKWDVLYVLDEDSNVVGALKTFF